MRYYYDLHIHSALSPCGDDDMTPNNIVNMSLLNGLDIIALSDHNTCGNVKVTADIAKKSGITFLPAVEVETAEEIHVLCLFADVEKALEFEKQVLVSALPDIQNNESIFGKQQIFDNEDNVVATDPRYLINATTLDIDTIGAIVESFGGVAIPAHIDKSTKSIIAMLGMVDKSMGFNTFELSKNASADYTKTEFSLKDGGYSYVYNTDAHYLYDIAEKGERNYFEIEPPLTPQKIISHLKNGQF